MTNRERFTVMHNEDLNAGGYEVRDEGFSVFDSLENRVVGSDGGEPEDQLLIRDWRWVTEALNAVDAARAAAESRAREAEADCAAMREALRMWSSGDALRRADVWKVTNAALTPHPGAPLLAELEAARDLIEGYEPQHVIGCMARRSHENKCDCGFDAALAKYEAARGAR